MIIRVSLSEVTVKCSVLHSEAARLSRTRGLRCAILVSPAAISNSNSALKFQDRPRARRRRAAGLTGSSRVEHRDGIQATVSWRHRRGGPWPQPGGSGGVPQAGPGRAGPGPGTRPGPGATGRRRRPTPIMIWTRNPTPCQRTLNGIFSRLDPAPARPGRGRTTRIVA